MLLYGSTFGQYYFSIEINDEKLSGKKIFLNILNNKNFIPLKMDSAIVENGKVFFSGHVKQPSNFATLRIYDGKSFQNQFVLDSGKNHITIGLPDPATKNLRIHSDAKGALIYNELNQIAVDMAAKNTGPQKVGVYANIPPELRKQLWLDQLQVLKSYPNDFSSLLCLYTMSKSQADPESSKNILSLLAQFSKVLNSSELGIMLYDEQTALIKNKIAASVGNQVPMFQIRDINNTLFTNSSLKGQNYMIVFSATWCIPCQEQLPKLKKLYDEYKEKGLKVVYFNNDDNVVRWKEHVKKNKLDWINVSERQSPRLSKIQKSFGVYAIPTCLVVNKQGKIVYNSDEDDTSITHLDEYLKKVLNN